MEVSFDRKTEFFAKFSLFLGGWGPYWAGTYCWGNYLAIFSRGGKKWPKIEKKHEKVEISQFFKIGPKVKIWTYRCEVGPKKCVFSRQNKKFYLYGYMADWPAVVSPLVEIQQQAQQASVLNLLKWY